MSLKLFERLRFGIMTTFF